MNGDLACLVGLGRADAEVRSTEGKLSDLAKELQILERRRQAEVDAFERRKDEHAQLRRTATQQASEVDELDVRVRSYQHKLDNDIVSYKEMEHLREQIRLLRAKMDKLAEESLSLMEEAERDEVRLQEEAEGHRQRLARLDEEMGRVRERVEALQDQHAQQVEQMKGWANKLPPHIMEHYRRLREQLPNPLVPVESGSCGGCRLKLSETRLERVRAGREVVMCENCSRFMFWPEG